MTYALARAMRLRIGAGCAWAAIALAACWGPSPCSGTRRGHTGASGSGSADEACTDWASHYCSRLEYCAPLSAEIAYGDVARCIARNKLVCFSALSANGSGETPNSLKTCAQAYDSAGCEDVVVAKPPESCRVAGSLRTGDSCGDDSQCSGANGYCRMNSDQTCGTCSELGASGAGCESARDCAYGLVCYFTCMLPVAPGGSCDGMTRQCPETLVCFNYTCKSPGQPGAPCDPRADDCDRDHALFCDPQARVCSHYAVAEVGAPCGPGTICKAANCVYSGEGQQSTCVANAIDGASCNPVAGPFCMAPARCVDGVCKVPDASMCD
jgi:hypothetical protein